MTVASLASSGLRTPPAAATVDATAAAAAADVWEDEMADVAAMDIDDDRLVADVQTQIHALRQLPQAHGLGGPVSAGLPPETPWPPPDAAVASTPRRLNAAWDLSVAGVLVLDTNYVVSHTAFVDRLIRCLAPSSLRVLLPYVVLMELDRLKLSASRATRAATADAPAPLAVLARRAIRLLGSHLVAGTRSLVGQSQADARHLLRQATREPPASLIADGDEQILAYCVATRQRHRIPVVLLTHDATLACKCVVSGIATLAGPQGATPAQLAARLFGAQAAGGCLEDDRATAHDGARRQTAPTSDVDADRRLSRARSMVHHMTVAAATPARDGVGDVWMDPEAHRGFEDAAMADWDGAPAQHAYGRAARGIRPEVTLPEVTLPEVTLPEVTLPDRACGLNDMIAVASGRRRGSASRGPGSTAGARWAIPVPAIAPVFDDHIPVVLELYHLLVALAQSCLGSGAAAAAAATATSMSSPLIARPPSGDDALYRHDQHEADVLDFFARSAAPCHRIGRSGAGPSVVAAASDVAQAGTLGALSEVGDVPLYPLACFPMLPAAVEACHHAWRRGTRVVARLARRGKQDALTRGNAAQWLWLTGYLLLCHPGPAVTAAAATPSAGAGNALGVAVAGTHETVSPSSAFLQFTQQRGRILDGLQGILTLSSNQKPPS
ncbi:hypothetical protein CXG81DRAFT_19380 [Caulochytrium protostelioides]|uniref:PIN domain-containing protein n=1 Tax=Caulochytrium protostelioides TaxID=1555241 RepID=A0A4P9X6B8_9FUNG|nr:hypothetical protein CXG81DRAFT_19380 [Caulochytrium protostelioides]|eukprot:RKP00726.1 hypothetical protein CXG81DRAFT_19380 [Caulochytrium protostelioides]